MPVDAADRVRADSVAEPEGEAPIDGARMVAALRTSAAPVAFGVAFVTLMAFVISLAATDRYRATARIVQGPPGLTAPSTGTDQRGLTTSLALLTTPAVRTAAARRVPGESAASLQAKVTAHVESGANVIDVTATDSSPDRAAAIANAVANGFLDQRAVAERTALARTSSALRAQLASRPPADEATAIRTRLGDLAVQGANAGSDLQLAEAAQPPSSPYAPRPLRNAVVAFFAALFVGVIAVLVLERLRPRTGGARELGRLLGVRVLASLPAVGRPVADGLAHRMAALGRRLPPVLRRPVTVLVAALVRRQELRDMRARAALDEAMHALLGAVVLDLAPGRRHVVLVTSPRREQGSARVAAGLARSLARAGQETLALSADLDSPRLSTELDVGPGPGLARALERSALGGGAVLGLPTIPGVAGLAVVPYDGAAHDDIGLLRPGAVEALFATIDASSYGFVVVEAPGLLSAPEPRLVARHAGSILLACPIRAPAQDVVDARDVLQQLAVPVLGVVATAGESRASEAHGASDRPAMPASRSVDDWPVPSANGASPTAEHETRELVARLRAAGRPLTAAELRRDVGDLSSAHLRARLRQLVERGEIERSGTGRRSDPYVYGVRER